jgi:hypothetical protein
MVPDAVYCQNPLRYKTSRGKVVLFVVYRFCYIDQLEPFHLRLHLVQKKREEGLSNRSIEYCSSSSISLASNKTF